MDFMALIKKLWSVLSNIPAISSLVKKSISTGKIDMTEALDAASSISPDTKKIVNAGMRAAINGGTFDDVVNGVMGAGTVKINGAEIDMKNLVPELRNRGGFGSMLANIIEKIPKQSVKETVDMADAMSDIRNWRDLVK